jgi:hypothetical protein
MTFQLRVEAGKDVSYRFYRRTRGLLTLARYHCAIRATWNGWLDDKEDLILTYTSHMKKKF